MGFCYERWMGKGLLWEASPRECGLAGASAQHPSVHPAPPPARCASACPAPPRSGVSSRIVDANCGTYATFALTADGHVFAFGLNNYGQLALPGALWAGQ